MNQPIRKASRSLYKPRSGVGLGKGSHQPFQSLVEPVIRSVRNADERLGFVQGWGVCGVYPAGGSLEVSSPSQGQPYARRLCAGDNAPVDARVGRHPLPPHPTVPLWGMSRNFSPAFPRKGLTDETANRQTVA